MEEASAQARGEPRPSQLFGPVARQTLDEAFPAPRGRPVVLWPLTSGPSIEDTLASLSRRSAPASGEDPTLALEPAAPPESQGPKAVKAPVPPPISQSGAAAPPLLPAMAAPPAMEEQTGRGSRIAIVIDDVGYDAAAARRAMALPGSVTLAFLAEAPNAQRLAAEVRAQGGSVMLHLPMEPDGKEDPGERPLLVHLSDEDNLARLRWHMARLGDFDGVNNHMGSGFTRDALALKPVLQEIGARGVFFLDSRTSSDSIAYEVAGALGLTAYARDVFIDHTRDRAEIAARLEDAERVSARKGLAILIGHPLPETLDMLESWMPDAERRGFVFVYLRDVPASASLAAAGQ